MMSSKKIKELAKEGDKKISKEAVNELKKYLLKIASSKIISASKNADLNGRIIINLEDIKKTFNGWLFLLNPNMILVENGGFNNA